MVQNGELEIRVSAPTNYSSYAAFLPISEIAHIGRQLADTLGSARRLHAVNYEEVSVNDGIGVNDTRTGELSFEDVIYLPGRNIPALKAVTLSIKPGQTAALVGPSGAGKTTLAHLLLRFWDPMEGALPLKKMT